MHEFPILVHVSFIGICAVRFWLINIAACIFSELFGIRTNGSFCPRRIEEPKIKTDYLTPCLECLFCGIMLSAEEVLFDCRWLTSEVFAESSEGENSNSQPALGAPKVQVSQKFILDFLTFLIFLECSLESASSYLNWIMIIEVIWKFLCFCDFCCFPWWPNSVICWYCWKKMKKKKSNIFVFLQM